MRWLDLIAGDVMMQDDRVPAFVVMRAEGGMVTLLDLETGEWFDYRRGTAYLAIHGWLVQRDGEVYV